MKQLNIKCFSLCSDFNPDDGHETLFNQLSKHVSCDVYIEYTAHTAKWEEDNGYDNDLVSNRLIDLGAEEGEDVLIHIDY